MPVPRVQAKLTLRLPREDLDFLQEYAVAHELSVVEVIARHLSQLRDQGGEAADLAGVPKPRGASAALRVRFDQLVEEWREATRFISSLTDMMTHPAYQRIIGMGAAAVPLLLEELRHQPDHWFWALQSITGENPVPEEARGDIEGMGAAWLSWGQRHGYC